MLTSVYQQTEWFNGIDTKINTLFPDLRHELLEEPEQNINISFVKTPELSIRINKININTLIDTGSAINALSEEWYNNNEDKIGKHEILHVNNTTIISAIGRRSKHVRKQIFCEIHVNNKVKYDCVFLIVPGLARECILRMQFLKQTHSKIDIERNNILMKTDVNAFENEESFEIPLMEAMEEILRNPDELVIKLDNIRLAYLN